MHQLNGQQKGFNPLLLEWYSLHNHSTTLLPYHAATELQQLWCTCELRSDQLLPDWPPLTPLGAFFGREVFLVHPRRGVEVRPMGKVVGLHPSERGTPWHKVLHPDSERMSILAWMFRATYFFFSLRAWIRKCNSCKCCREALNVDWQDYCHLISSKLQNTDGMIRRRMCCVSLLHCDLFDLKDLRHIFTKCLMGQTSPVNENIQKKKTLYGFHLWHQISFVPPHTVMRG